MLVCTAHEGGGGKLPPFVIFKRKIMTKDDSHLVSSLETTRSAGWNLFGKNDQEPTKFTCVGRFPVPQNTQNWAGPEAEGYNASHNSGRNGQHFTATGRQQWQTDGKRWIHLKVVLGMFSNWSNNSRWNSWRGSNGEGKSGWLIWGHNKSYFDSR